MNKETIEKVATFVSQATPGLAKLAQLESGAEQLAQHITDRMISVGLMPQHAKQASIDAIKSDFAAGRLTKVAEAVDFLVDNVGPRPLGEGVKTASEQPVTGEKASDRIWKKNFGG
jgi:hypothetical protein